jgi:hypothetical protein
MRALSLDLSPAEQHRMFRYFFKALPDFVVFQVRYMYLTHCYRQESYSEETLKEYLTLVKLLIHEGSISLAQDFVSRIDTAAPDSGFSASAAPLFDIVGDFDEEPLAEFFALYQRAMNDDGMPDLFDLSDGAFADSYETCLPAWLELRREHPDVMYQHMSPGERQRFVEAFMELISQYIGTIDRDSHYRHEIDKIVLLGCWRATVADENDSQFGLLDTDGTQVEEEDEAPAQEVALPAFDDENYLRCVDIIHENVDYFLPDIDREDRAFLFLFYLPVYASGYRAKELQQEIEHAAQDSYLYEFISDMFQVVKLLWDSLSMHDETGKASAFFDVFYLLHVYFNEIDSKDVIEVFLETLKKERKDIQRLRKDYKNRRI